ncbi:MAG: hypothetical protein AAGJ84_07155 [Pseudomonadota bacterium]
MILSKVEFRTHHAAIGLGLIFVGISACAEAPSEPDIVISSRDFVMVPCAESVAEPCALAVAGGKRVLFGAPSGADLAFADEDLTQLDAVMLFSLRAKDIEGLDTVRNRSWQAGRRAPLLVIGPDGTSLVVDGLNTAFETPDALFIVDEGMPAGGFDAALLTASDLPLTGGWITAFDTGDFRIEARDLGAGHGHFRLSYQAEFDLVGSCEVWRTATADVQQEEVGEPPFGCPGSDVPSWPIDAPIWFVRSGGDSLLD